MRATFRCVAYAETRLPEEEENPVRLWEQRPLQKCATSVNSEHASLPNLRGECKSLVAYHFAVVVQLAGHRPRNAMIPVQLRAMAPFLPGRLRVGHEALTFGINVRFVVRQPTVAVA